MIEIKKILKAIESSSLKPTLKQELENLDPATLPLQKGLAHSSQVSGSEYSVIILSVKDEPAQLLVKTGIQYKGIISGCSCADDPTPNNEINEYCDVLFSINKKTAEYQAALLED